MKANLPLSSRRLALAVGALVTCNTTSAAVLEEVVVTAQKREQSMQDVPISLSVVGGDEIADFALRDFSDLSSSIPNFYVQDTPGNYSIFIRGMGSTAGNLAFEQTVGLFVDGVYAGKARQFQSPFLDLERIEVLRGPQGALVGKNTSAGAVNVITARPTEDPEITLSTSYEFEGETVNTTGILSGPLSDGLYGRVAASYTNTDRGFTENTHLGGHEKQVEDTVVRGVVAWDALDRLEAVAKLEVGRSRIDGNSYETLLPGEKLDYKRATGGFPGMGSRDYNDTDSNNASLTLNYDINEFTLTSITGYSSYDFEKFVDADFSSADLFGSIFAEDFTQISQEIRLTSPASDTLDYIVGLYWHTSDYELYQSSGIDLGPFDGRSYRFFDQDNDVYSLYAQGTWYVSDSLRVSLGLRQTEDDKDADQKRSLTGVTPSSWLDSPLTGKRDESEFDPSINVQWDATQDIMIYASWSEGSKAGGFVGGQSVTVQSDFEFEPEDAETYELGTKLVMLDNSLTINAAYFYTEYTNLQVSNYYAPTNSFITGNAASATTEGVEMDFAWLPLENLTVTGSASYLDAYYDDYPGAACLWNNPDCDVSSNNIGGTYLPRANRVNGTLTLNHEQLLGNMRLDSRLELVYNGKRALIETLAPQGVQGGFTKINLRLALSPESDRWTLALVGKNLTDKTTFSHAFSTPLASVPDTFSKMVDPPRTVALQFEYRFL
ncbi:TonB-dependent receptor [Parahaliea mediterranea]|uniref:TonB-dependent receptor n=1 Tax=Parahaliea mediterranea TaxID=651086 RepID=UPI000E2F1477|nr:TonB-dependent receptor [Parahaliea mediterranea]